MAYWLGGNWDMIDAINDRTLAAAGDDYSEGDGLEAMTRRVRFVDDKLIAFKRQYPFEVPTVEEMKDWIKEAMKNEQ